VSNETRKPKARRRNNQEHQIEKPLLVQIAEENTNRNTFKYYFDLVVGVASLVVVVFTFLTLVEMKNTRESAYKPFLAIRDTIIELESIPGLEFDNPSEQWNLILTAYTYGDIVLYNYEETLTPNLSFRLENIGLGIAKNVKAEWSTENVSAFIEYYQTLRVPCNEFVFGSYYSNSSPSVKYDGYQLLSGYQPNSFSTAFIRPFESGDSNYIDIDASYYGFLYFWSFMGEDYDSVKPSLILNLTYEDVYSVIHHAYIEINCSWTELPYSDDRTCIVTFFANVTEID